MLVEFDVSLLNCLPPPKFAASFDMSVVKVSCLSVIPPVLKINTTTNAWYFLVLGEEVHSVQVVSRLWLVKKFRYSLLIGRAFWPGWKDPTWALLALDASNVDIIYLGWLIIINWVANVERPPWRVPKLTFRALAIRPDEGVTLETSALKLLTVVILRCQLSVFSNLTPSFIIHLDYFQELKRCFLFCFVLFFSLLLFFFFNANLCGKNDKHFSLFKVVLHERLRRPIDDICHALRNEWWKYFFFFAWLLFLHAPLIKTRRFLLELA